MTSGRLKRQAGQIFGVDAGVALGLVAALLFFVLSGLVTYVNFQSLREGNQKIVQTHMAIVSLDELLSQVQDAETGQRGFLLTGEEAYLAPYNAALRAIPEKIQQISEQTLGNAGQSLRLSVLKNHVDAKLAELGQTIAVRREQGLQAALAMVGSDTGKEQMDAIRAQIGAMSVTENNVRATRLSEMARAQNQALFSTIVAAFLGVVLTLVIGYLIRMAALNRAREDWIRNGEAGLASAMIGNQRVEALGESILDFLAGYAGAVAGAFFVGGPEEFARRATFGVPGDARMPTQFRQREGLLGQAVISKATVTIDNVPDGYLVYGSGLGQAKPETLVISPGIFEGAVNSVLELGFTGGIDDRLTALLERTAEDIALAVQAAAYRSELQNLLEETQQQSEELQTQGEELRVSNEELEEQSRVLRESEARLQQQQSELEQINSHLEEQANQLELQRTDLQKAHASVQLKAQELERASQYKSDFLANMSHELRTPLNSSLILARLLADNPEDNLTAEQVRYAQTIESSGNDLLSLINDILDLSKIEAGHVEIRPEIVPLDRVVSNLRLLFQPLADEKKLEFGVAVAEGCPQAVETDPLRLEQVLRNLLGNAVKFTQRGAVRLTIEPGDDKTLAFRVSDTGIGIAREQQQGIFEAFHQADGTISRKFGGTGLGLSISRQLVRLLGGTITVESEPGHGSTFTVTLPVSRDRTRTLKFVPSGAAANMPDADRVEAAPVQPLAIPNRVEDDRHQLSGEKRVLLVIEDDDAFAAIVRDLSRQRGFQSLVARTAEEAMRIARDYAPSAIVLDVGLPDESGLAVLDRLKNDVKTRHIPIHVVSAGDHTQTAYSLGAVGYLTKPVSRDQLVGVLSKLEERLSQRVHRVLIVEDDARQRDAVALLLGSDEVETVTASTAAQCLELLSTQSFDCMVLDLSLPDASGFSLLETISRESAYAFPPVIVYTGRELSAESEQKLRRYSRSIIIKGAKSPERLLDEVSLFLHQVVSELPAEQQRMIRKARNRDALLEGRRILVVEDDIRNVYALSNILEPRGALVEIARNGQEALETLARAEDADKAIDLVLMDVMMPVMDGLTATREIRKDPRWQKLPVITLTAKAMPDDQQRCIEAGASDYMAKPLDVDKLLSLVRVWMPK